jgi:DNA (cytosine-5)-methyltransferase 1
MGAGLKGSRSGTFWPFWNLIERLRKEGRAPKAIVLENVCGALTSHGGADFRSIIRALRLGGYRVGAIVIDAALFLPQSRPRLFLIGVQDKLAIPLSLVREKPEPRFHTRALLTAYSALPEEDRSAWIWWNLSSPLRRQTMFPEVIEEDVPWNDPESTQTLLEMMSPINKAKVEAAKELGGRRVGALYKRTRPDGTGKKVQRAEVRFDIAGCLRTPGGGSSRQSILVIEDGQVRSRLLSPREAARLMGLPDCYILPDKYNDAYHLMGDGVAVPVVRHLARYILEPLLLARDKSDQEAA